LTLPDPAVTGEGALDPLGLATTGERLADWALPGMTARMNRPRFLTAIAVSAEVCKGLQEETAADGVTPASLVFEWLVVEGFARNAAERSDVERTPGIAKARACVSAEIPMSAKEYLKAPSVFGFHGVYRRLAHHVGIIDGDDLLGENGHLLLKTWEREQGLDSFLDSAQESLAAASSRKMLRDAVMDGLKKGYTKHGGGWQGWHFLAQYLSPAGVGKGEAQFLRSLLLDVKAETRGEVFQLVEEPENFAFTQDHHEAALVYRLLPQVSANLAPRLRAIIAYEEFCTLLETGFDWLRWLSSRDGTRTVPPSEFAAEPEVRRCAESLRSQLEAARRALKEAPPKAQSEFAEVASYFDTVSDAAAFHGALLHRHGEVQNAKPPEGKQPWFAQTDNGAVIVRVPYRLDEPPGPRDWWSRPYRLGVVYSFCRDLK
jgi:hypothetical protein